MAQIRQIEEFELKSPSVYPAWMPVETLGVRIKRLREARGWSLRDMASHGQISAATLSRVERDKFDLTLSSLLHIAQALDMDVIALLSGVQFNEED